MKLIPGWNIDLNKLKKALQTLSNTYKFNVSPDYVQLLSMGRAYYDKKEYEMAISIYKLGLKAYSTGLQLNGYVAQAYLKNNQIEKAKEHFDIALKRAVVTKSPMIPWLEKQLKRL